MDLSIALILIVIIAAFAAAWRWMPAGYLTAVTGTLGSIVTIAHTSLADSMYDLQQVIPEEYRPILAVAFLLLTVAARFRNHGVQ